MCPTSLRKWLEHWYCWMIGFPVLHGWVRLAVRLSSAVLVVNASMIIGEAPQGSRPAAHQTLLSILRLRLASPSVSPAIPDLMQNALDYPLPTNTVPPEQYAPA